MYYDYLTALFVYNATTSCGCRNNKLSLSIKVFSNAKTSCTL